MPKSRHLRAFKFDEFTLKAILTGKALPIPLPEGIEIIRFAHRWEDNSGIVIIEHPDFEEVPEGEVIPLQQVMTHLIKS